jgi:hypothetical protein
MVTFLSRQYRLVYMLDISPSAASTDIKKGCVLLEQMVCFAIPKYLLPGLSIRIDLLRIRIQHFCSSRIRFRIQAKTELSKTISFSNFFEIKI